MKLPKIRSLKIELSPRQVASRPPQFLKQHLERRILRAPTPEDLAPEIPKTSYHRFQAAHAISRKLRRDLDSE